MASPTLGDTLINSAAVKDVRDRYPEAHIVYLSSPTSAAAVKLLPSIDEIVDIEITKPAKTIRTIRKCRLDLMLDFTPWQRLTAIYTTLSGAKHRVGFRSDKQFRHFGYDAVAEHSRNIHELDNFRNLLRTAGISPGNEPSLITGKRSEEHITKNETIVFHPWASGDRRQLREWPQENWVALARLLDNGNTTFVVTGGPNETTVTEALTEKLRSEGRQANPFRGGSGLDDLCALLKNAKLVVSVNTGIMHLAAILGAPTIALNGPTATHRWGPIGANARSVEPESGGGFLHFGFEFDGNPTDTMQRISVTAVANVADSMVEANAWAQRAPVSKEH
jgi:ADP-heptose:LPS heptosyltransferase